MSATSRYQIKNLTEGLHSTRKVREPWAVIDTSTNRIVDELSTKKAALLAASNLNRATP